MSEETAEDWPDFLELVHACRIRLRCSISSAWFRGHAESYHDLNPSILRIYNEGPLSDAELTGSPLSAENYAELYDVIQSDAPVKLKISADQAKLIKSLLDQYRKTSKHLAVYSSRVSRLQSLRKSMWLAHRRQTANIDLSRLMELAEEFRLAITPNNKNRNTVQCLLSLDINAVEALYQDAEKLAKATAVEKDALRLKVEQTVCVAYGERDAYSAFKFMTPDRFSNGWGILASMQHYGIPTRLLDWTESLFVALCFALERHIQTFHQKQKEHPARSAQYLIEAACASASAANEPAIWVMNPYSLAQKATGMNSLVDFTSGKGMDYFTSFFEVGWIYSRPIPMYSPWSADSRLLAQHAMFTVHGRDLRPLNAQVGKEVVTKINLGRRAAFTAACQLSSLFHVDRFSLFQDRDSLGKTIRDKYLRG